MVKNTFVLMGILINIPYQALIYRTVSALYDCRGKNGIHINRLIGLRGIFA